MIACGLELDDNPAKLRGDGRRGRTVEVMVKSSVPGIVDKHVIVSEQCRRNRGDIGAIDEALSLLRHQALETLPHVVLGAKLHFVLTVENPVVNVVD